MIGLLLEQPINPHSRYPGGCLGPIPVVLTAMIGIPFMAISVLMDILILIFKKELSLVKFIINLALLGSFIFILFLLGNIY
ncbi:MAG: hypothetical protein CSA38_01645 [Flavobacteriales bacterium]|nr:MAG: hypothetical protein CSA38_01645 [Flavobacteriales bacterium]